MRCRSNGDITQRVRTTHLEPTFFCTAPTDANHRLRTDSYDGCPNLAFCVKGWNTRLIISFSLSLNIVTNPHALLCRVPHSRKAVAGISHTLA